jgi:hypothetical protein
MVIGRPDISVLNKAIQRLETKLGREINHTVYSPDIKNRHKTVVRFTGLALGGKHEILVNDFDLIRRKRHAGH